MSFIPEIDPYHQRRLEADERRRARDHSRMRRLLEIQDPTLEMIAGPPDTSSVEQTFSKRNPLVRALKSLVTTLGNRIRS